MKKLSIFLTLAILVLVFTGCPEAGSITPGIDDGTEQTADDSGTTNPAPDPDPVYYSVRYDANGATSGDTPVDSTHYEEAETATTASNSGSLVRTGYIFAGWCTTADGSGEIYTEGDTMTMGTADVNLYARWVKRGFIADGTGLSTSIRLGGSVDLTEDGSKMITNLAGYNIYQGKIAFYFQNTDGAWEYDASFTVPTGAAGDNFGTSLAIDDSGTTAVAGAARYEALDSEGLPVTKSGCAAIMTYENDAWVYKHTLTADIPQAEASFGYAVSVSGDGNTIVVGESYRDVDSFTDRGLIHIYTTSDAWDNYTHIELNDTYSANNHVGYSVDVNYDGSRIIAGSFNTLIVPKQIYIYDSTDNWTTKTRTQITSIYQNGAFGTSVACSADGNTLCVGDSYANDAGEAYLYRYSENTWTIESTFTPVNGAAYDYFGSDLDMSSDGRRVYIGARSQDIHESNAGMAYFFEYNNGSWDRFDSLIQESFSNIDQFGSGVAVSGNGKIIAAGCKQSDTFGADFGAVYFYIIEE